MDKNKKRTGRKKLSRQYAVMVFAVQLITSLALCFLVRAEAVNIYLSAKNDMISEILVKEAGALSMDNYNPTPSWELDYWKEHYTELDTDVERYDEGLTEEEEDHLFDFSYSLNGDEIAAEEYLNALPHEEQFRYAAFQFYGFLELFKRRSDYYGYEGCSCFMDLGNGEYMVLVDQDKDAVFINDRIYIEKNSDSKDKIMSELRSHTYTDNENTEVGYVRTDRTDENGKHHKLYVGFAPIVFDGEIKAVITLNYNYDSFEERINGMIAVALVILISVNLLVCVLFIHRTRRIAARPISSIQNAVREYMTTRDSKTARGKLNHIYSGNEIGVLAEDVDQMIADIDRHIDEIEKAGLRLRTLTKEVMEALASAIDAKDKYTHGHSSRVADYSRKLAEMDGLSEEECEKVYYSALLHDVGKIGVPSRIINKESRLTDEEYETIKKHPALGAQILGSISEFPYLSIGAHYHHERYDGRGYPEGLKGENIPKIARIVAVADAYDAMASKRSYRDPIPQQRVREEIVKGSGTQFDPEYARLMLRLIDIDTGYEMQEQTETGESTDNELVIGEYRSAVSDGTLIDGFMTTMRMSVGSDEEATGIYPSPSLLLFDSLDARAHSDEREIKDLLYFEYGELWFDGHADTSGARKIQIKVTDEGSPDIHKNGDYIIEAVRIKDHALIRLYSRNQTAEITVALPDSTRFMYIGLTGEHCRYIDVDISKAEIECLPGYIPRIADEISYIDVPAGDIPNVQVDGYRTAHSAGVPITDGLRLTFHAKSLPTARLVWHCPFIDIFCSDDGSVNGANYRDLAFMRFDGECWGCDPGCTVELDVSKNDDFKGWDAWKEFGRNGFDTTVTFSVRDNRITVATENAGIAVRNTAVISGISDPVYAAITGDQVAITDVRLTVK
ncbi:MAG: HD-GYP domain-containing protein [Ruminiclostridium sp.]|nr:HD-GYP domain-containing protein [Ruminiclostridium sp.]